MGKTFKQWWHERGSKLPSDVTRREVAITAWSAAMEQVDSLRAALVEAREEIGIRTTLQAAAENRAEQAESTLAAAKENEVRYLWLRDESYREPYAPGELYRNLFDGVGGRASSSDLKRVWLKYGPALDAAIDQARALQSSGDKTS